MDKIMLKSFYFIRNQKTITQLKMGIDGLLTLLKPIIKKQHISQFRNKTLAVDALPWIYKGIYGANIQLGGQINDQNQHAFLYYINQMIDMLEFYKITPIFVFDGRSLPAKNKTLEKRKKVRQDNKKKAEQLIENKEEEKAKKTIARLITIDQNKLCAVMSLLKQRKTKFVVAPYEADSQICKLYKLNKIDAVITEDSDLIIYGVDVILKLKQTGQCDFLTLKIDEQERQRIECPFVKKFLKFSQQKRIQTAILAGCDYVESVKGIGMKKALKLVEENDSLQKIVETLKKDPKLGNKVPQHYLQSIKTAKIIFFLARTYNPISEKLQYLQSSSLQDSLVNEIKNLSTEQIDEIVGRQYEFTKQTYQGDHSCKTNEKRDLIKIQIKKFITINRQSLGFEKKESRSVQIKANKDVRQYIIDETTSVCWQSDSINQGLAFLLQKELVERFFSNHLNKQSQIP